MSGLNPPVGRQACFILKNHSGAPYIRNHSTYEVVMTKNLVFIFFIGLLLTSPAVSCMTGNKRKRVDSDSSEEIQRKRQKKKFGVELRLI